MSIQWMVPKIKTEDTIVFKYSLFSSEDKLILAPLQNLTSLFFRKVYSKWFKGVFDYAISPFLSVSSNIYNTSKDFYRDVDIQANKDIISLVPQILGNNPIEILTCCQYLQSIGYKDINLNMGCPKRDIVNNYRGGGLLKDKKLVEDILTIITKNTDLNLSLKIRLGIDNEKEVEDFIDLFNSFNLKEIIIHPRTVRQQYGGEVNLEEFEFLSKHLKAEVVYNGDIFSVDDFAKLKTRLPNVKRWMIGRGVLQNPFLPAEIKNIHCSKDMILKPYIIDLMFEFGKSLPKYNDKAVLNKMKELSKYLCKGFNIDDKDILHSTNINDLCELFEKNFYTIT